MEELKQAQKDFLTAFYTREHLFSTLLQRITDANLHKEKFSILLIDIDRFKRINDKYGHLWGDEFLKFVASTLRLCLENKGLIFRYGGDEFVVLFSTRDPQEAYLLAKQFNQIMVKRPFLFNGRLFKITISCGLATYPDDAKEVEHLLKVADKALYFSKRYSRNTTTRAGKISFRRFQILSTLFMEALLIVALVFSLNVYILEGKLQRFLARFPAIRAMLPIGAESERLFRLKSGELIYGRIIAEDADKIIIEVLLGQGSSTMTLKRNLIKGISYAEASE